MTVTLSQVSVKPIEVPSTSSVDFGVEISGVDIEHLSGCTPWNGNHLRVWLSSPSPVADKVIDADFSVIHDALYNHQVVVIKNQSGLSPRAQYEITKRFDPTAESYGHGKTLDAKKSVLHPDLKTVPHQPQVQVIGNGFVPEYEGLKNVQLKHPHHKTFHKTRISDEDDVDFTRFYRWHIDAALYGLAPPCVTSLMAVRVPAGRRQTCRYDDGTGDVLDVPLGTTAFVSGYRMYEVLSDEDKEFVRTSKVEYAAHPYIWMSGAQSRSDGLGMESEGKELPESELPPIDQEKIQVLPMCWKNPVTGKLAVQIHPSAVRRIHLANGTVIEDLQQVRDIIHRIQRPGIAPELVYPHDWVEGDFVLFNNRGVLHSVVGAFKQDEVRLFRQCNLAASSFPEGPDGQTA